MKKNTKTESGSASQTTALSNNAPSKTRSSNLIHLEQQNKLYRAVTEAAEILLSSDEGDIGKSLYKAMEMMARSVDVDRVCILKKQSIGGKLCYEQIHEWPSDAAKSNTLSSKIGGSYIEPFPQWNQLFLSGKSINGPLSSLSELERNALSSGGVVSLLAVPIFIHDGFWGYASFDDCRKERTFSEDEVSILKSGSLHLANAIIRDQNKTTIEARMRQQELMATISRSFITKEPLDRQINKALKKTGEFMGVSRILLMMLDENIDNRLPAYTWIRSGEWTPKPVALKLSGILKSSFLNEIVSGAGYITAICCNDIYNEFKGKYKFLGEVDIKSFIWAPVYVENVFWGLVSVEDCEKHKAWSESDIQLVGTVSSSIAGAIARDLIDKARASALEQAVQASKAKGNFLANMSHEMRTPMNAIIGMTSIGKNSPNIEKKDYAFEKIENASSHLLGVINDILDISKIEANKFELSEVSFDFEMMLQKVVNVIAFKVEERSQDFTVRIDERIPHMLLGDDLRLAQVITNLLSNAVKFTPEKGRICLVAKLISEEENLFTIQIEVSDSGIGISQEQQAKLFNSFEQAENATARKFGGTGLGLAISRRIVELMGGRIWIVSEMGKGATFAFTIKAKRDFSINTTILSPDVNISNMRVLIIDDNPDILEYLSDIMARFGVSCDTASGGNEAIALMKEKGRHDLYFIDWKMSGMDGIELTRKIKEHIAREHSSEKSVIIMISATDWNNIEKEARDAGVNKFLPKPLFPSAVANVINECLDIRDKKKAGFDKEETDNFNGYAILLAEDVDINREIVLTILKPTALSIDCAENGREAVEKFSSSPEKYSMIFMDIQMPEMDGYEATRKIRELEAGYSSVTKTWNPVPIVAMTANVFREDIEKCIDCGMNDHVGKPLNLDEVLGMLRKYLPKKPVS